MTTSPQPRLIYSASESDANVLWATQFFAPDPFHSRNHTILKTGHVVTVEPGLYYPGMGGVRLEDVVLATKTGCKNLVRIPKILEV